jgi:hypothetical protein
MRLRLQPEANQTSGGLAAAAGEGQLDASGFGASHGAARRVRLWMLVNKHLMASL